MWKCSGSIRLPDKGERQPNKTPATPHNGGRVMGSCTIYLHSILTARGNVPGALRASDTTFCYTYLVYCDSTQKSSPKFARELEPPRRKEREENIARQSRK